MLFIISEKDDVHLQPVIEQMNNDTYFILYTEDFLKRYIIKSYSYLGISYFEIQDKYLNKILNSESITTIWFRRYLKAETRQEYTNKIFKDICIEEANGFIEYMKYTLIDKYWLTGHPIYETIAESKLVQMRVAHQVGFNFPETIFSNSKTNILPILSKYDKVVLKPISHKRSSQNEVSLFFFSKVFDSDFFVNKNDADFEHTIQFIQPYIEKKFELRVTIVENQVFACKLNSQLLAENEGKHDWRQGYNFGLEHSEFDLPNEVTEKCFLFLKNLNLNFGCFDFIVTPNDEYVFLECNPNGQWLWIEHETTMKISTAIAELLTSKIV
jgi:hypothetical protein